MLKCDTKFFIIRTYAVREKLPEIGGVSAAHTPYFRASHIQVRNS